MSIGSHLSWRSPRGERSLSNALQALSLGLEELPSQAWAPKTGTIGGVRDIDLATLCAADDAWSFLLLPLNSELAESIATKLSTTSSYPVAAFYEYDQRAWGFTLYREGVRVGRYCNAPSWIGEPPETMTISPDLVAEAFGVPVSDLAGYLRHIDESTSDSRVFPDDEFTLADHWVRCDLMRRLGLEYPDMSASGCRRVKLVERGAVAP